MRSADGYALYSCFTLRTSGPLHVRHCRRCNEDKYAADDYFQYFDVEDVSSCQKTLSDLEAFIATEAPFDGIIGFFQGAASAATLIAQRRLGHFVDEAANPVFKCAVFLGAGLPCDPASLEEGRLRGLRYNVDGDDFHVPTICSFGGSRMLPHILLF